METPLSMTFQAMVARASQRARRGQRAREQDVHELGRAIDRPPVVAAGGLQVVPVDLAHAVCVAGDHDHAGGGGGAQQRQEAEGGLHVAEVVDAEGHLEAIGGGAALHVHGAGVVDQDVEGREAGGGLGAGGPDAGEARHVGEQRVDLRARSGDAGDLGGGGLGFVGRAAHQHEVGALGGEGAGGPQADARGGAGDEDGFSADGSDGADGHGRPPAVRAVSRRRRGGSTRWPGYRGACPRRRSTASRRTSCPCPGSSGSGAQPRTSWRWQAMSPRSGWPFSPARRRASGCCCPCARWACSSGG